MRARTSLPCVAILLAGLVSPGLGQSNVRWQTNLDAARHLAKQTNRLILIHFWSDACPPCLRMEREVFNQPEVAAAIEANYVAVKVDAPRNPNLVQKYGVKSWPTDIVVTAEGTLVDQSNGFLAAPQYKLRMTRIAANAKSQMLRTYAQVPGGSAPTAPPSSLAAAPRVPEPAPAPTAPTNPTMPNPTMAALPSPGGYATPPWQSEPARSPTQVQPATQPTPPDMRMTADSLPAQSPIAPGQPSLSATAPTADPRSLGQAPVSPNPRQLYPSPAPSAPSPAPTPAVQVADRIAAVGQDTQPNSPAAQAAPEAARARAINPPLALEGYCPVSLAEKERWVKGNSRFGVIHRGRTYLFAGPDEARRFYNNPERYAPAVSGNDVVLMLDDGESVAGRREHGAWFDGRMYLFSNATSFEKFSRDPERYASSVVERASNTRRLPETSSSPSVRSQEPASERPSSDRRGLPSRAASAPETAIPRWDPVAKSN